MSAPRRERIASVGEESMMSLSRQRSRRKVRAGKAKGNPKSEARERQLMADAEWDECRGQWWSRMCSRTNNVIHVFISSTFNDMHGERDMLTRVVFPELNQRLETHMVRAVPIDLRWGLTKEDTSDEGLGALEHCFIEIDRSRPFFVMLLGERYGWVPPEYRTRDLPQYDWLKSVPVGKSITAMEAYYGFLRKPFTPAYAFCYKRNPQFIDTIEDPEEKQVFMDCKEGDETFAKKDALQREIAQHHYATIREYTCEYGGKDDEGKPYVKGLEAFSKQVADDLYRGISREFPPVAVGVTVLEEERYHHQQMIDSLASGFVGRKQILDLLMRHADGKLKQPDLNTEGGALPLVLFGESGSGKSSTLSAFCKRYEAENPRAFVLAHRLIEEIDQRFGLHCFPERTDFLSIKTAFFSVGPIIPPSPQALTLSSKIAMEDRRTLILVIDGVNQVSSAYGAQSMDWLPSIFPPCVRCVISTTKEGTGANVMKCLRLREREPPFLFLPALTREERKEIVASYLATYRKRLTEEQLELLVSKKDSANPLFLQIACEELRFLGLYGLNGIAVTEAVENLPAVTPDLFSGVLDRVERDMQSWSEDYSKGQEGAGQVTNYIGKSLVRYALCYIHCSRSGARESDLLELLHPPGLQSLPLAIWSRLIRSLALYLSTNGINGEGCITFFHMQLSLAVTKRYLQNAVTARHIYANLSFFYKRKADPTDHLEWRGGDPEALMGLPYLYCHAEDYKGIHFTLGNLVYIKERFRLGLLSVERLLTDYQDVILYFSDLPVVRAAEFFRQNHTDKLGFFELITQFLVFASSQRPKLEAEPDMIFQLALNQPNGSAPYHAAMDLIGHNAAPQKWIDYLNKPHKDSLLSEFAGFKSSVSCILLSADNTSLIIGFGNGTLHSVNSITGELIRVMSVGGHTRTVSTIACDGDGLKIASGSEDRSIVIWDALNGTRLGICTSHQMTVTCVSFVPGSGKSYLVSSSLDNSIVLWSLKWSELEEVEFAPCFVKDWMASSVLSLSFNFDGTLLCTGCLDGSIILWDAHAPSLGLVEISRTSAHEQGVLCVRFAHFTGLLLTSGADCSVTLWSVPEFRLLSAQGIRRLGSFGSHTDAVNYCEFSPDDSLFVTAGADSNVFVYSRTTLQQRATIVSNASAVTRALLLNTNNQLITCSKDDAIRRFDITESDENPRRVSVERVQSMVSSMTVVQKRKMKQIDYNKVMDYPKGRHTDAITSICLSEAGDRYITGSRDTTARVWSFKEGTELAILMGHGDPVVGAIFFGADQRILTATAGSRFLIWNAITYRHLLLIDREAPRSLSGSSSIASSLGCAALSISNELLLGGYDNGDLVRIQAETGEETAQDNSPENRHCAAITAAQWFADDRAVTGDAQGAVKVWGKKGDFLLTLLPGKALSPPRGVTTEPIATPDGILFLSITRNNTRVNCIDCHGTLSIFDRYHRIVKPVTIPRRISSTGTCVSDSAEALRPAAKGAAEKGGGGRRKRASYLGERSMGRKRSFLPDAIGIRFVTACLLQNESILAVGLSNHSIIYYQLTDESVCRPVASFICSGDITVSGAVSSTESKVFFGINTGKVYILDLQELNAFIAQSGYRMPEHEYLATPNPEMDTDDLGLWKSSQSVLHSAGSSTLRSRPRGVASRLLDASRTPKLHPLLIEESSLPESQSLTLETMSTHYLKDSYNADSIPSEATRPIFVFSEHSSPRALTGREKDSLQSSASLDLFEFRETDLVEGSLHFPENSASDGVLGLADNSASDEVNHAVAPLVIPESESRSALIGEDDRSSMMVSAPHESSSIAAAQDASSDRREPSARPDTDSGAAERSLDTEADSTVVQEVDSLLSRSVSPMAIRLMGSSFSAEPKPSETTPLARFSVEEVPSMSSPPIDPNRDSIRELLVSRPIEATVSGPLSNRSGAVDTESPSVQSGRAAEFRTPSPFAREMQSRQGTPEEEEKKKKKEEEEDPSRTPSKPVGLHTPRSKKKALRAPSPHAGDSSRPSSPGTAGSSDQLELPRPHRTSERRRSVHRTPKHGSLAESPRTPDNCRSGGAPSSIHDHVGVISRRRSSHMSSDGAPSAHLKLRPLKTMHGGMRKSVIRRSPKKADRGRQSRLSPKCALFSPKGVVSALLHLPALAESSPSVVSTPKDRRRESRIARGSCARSPGHATLKRLPSYSHASIYYDSFPVRFPESPENPSDALFVPEQSEIDLGIAARVFESLRINVQKIRCALCLFTGTQPMPQRPARLRELAEAVISLTTACGCAILDNGKQSPLMTALGVAQRKTRLTLRRIGVCSERSCSYPGGSDDAGEAGQVGLDFNHSHFVLVDSEDASGETVPLFGLLELLRLRAVVCALFFSDSATTLADLARCLEHAIPVVLIEGGTLDRLCGQLRVARATRATPAGLDAALGEALLRGDVTVLGAGAHSHTLRDRVAEIFRRSAPDDAEEGALSPMRSLAPSLRAALSASLPSLASRPAQVRRAPSQTTLGGTLRPRHPL